MKYIYHEASDILKSGQVIAYPTESVFGLGVDPLNSEAIARLLALKGRNQAMGLILISHDLDALRYFLAPLTQEEAQLLLTQHEGYTHTWLVPPSVNCPQYLCGDFDTIAVRITQHPIPRQICQIFGPIVSTSANPHGLSPARSAEQVYSYFGKHIHVVAGELGHLSQPTRIIDLKSLVVVRT